MKHWGLGCLALLIGVGCGTPSINVEKDGEKVSIDARGNMSVTDKEGTTTMKTEDGVTRVEGKDGTKMEFSEEGFSAKGTNEKGEKFDVSKDAVKESELGLPFYPGSESTSLGGGKIEGPDGMSFAVWRSTKDDIAKVAEFYKSKFKTTTQSMEQKGDDGKLTMALISGKLENGSDASVTATGESGSTLIQISVTKPSSKN